MSYALAGALTLLLSLLLSVFGAHIWAAQLASASQQHTFDQALIWLRVLGLVLLWAQLVNAPVRAALRWPMWLLAFGSYLFAAALLVSAVQGFRLGLPLAPIGGSAMLLAWLFICVQLGRNRRLLNGNGSV